MMGQRAEGGCVVITGASSGIGRATAEAFARQGRKLVLAARDAGPLEEVAAKCRRLGAEVIVMQLDVADAEAVCELAACAVEFCPAIDLWFSNVGVGAVGRFSEVPTSVHKRIVHSNLIGHMNDAHAALPIFQAQGHGIFVNMISVGGIAAAPYGAAYCASKFGLRGFSESLRAELTDFPRIYVCDVYPSFVDTPAIGHAGNYTGKQLSAPPPLLDPRRVADAVVDLLRKPRDTVLLGVPTRAAKLAHSASPFLTSWGTKLGFDRYFASADPAAVTSGNIFSPRRDGARIDGGLRLPQSRRVARAAGVIGVIAVSGLAMALNRRVLR